MIDIKVSIYKKLCDKYIYSGLAYDNNYIYVTVPHQYEIVRYNKKLEEIDIHRVCKGYELLCYDNYYNCFWATSKKERNKILKLDNYFKEITSIYIKVKNIQYLVIDKIKCTDEKTLTLYGEFGQIIIEKDEKYVYICNENIENNTLGKHFVEIMGNKIYCSGNKSANWKITDDKSNKYNINCPLPYNCDIIDTAYSNLKYCEKEDFYMLLKKNYDNTYIFKLEIFNNTEQDCNISLLNENSLNYNDGIGEIIKSIALMESSLSHILIAEGEKIQKVLCSTDNACDILKVNDSVNKTIVNISHLEQILYSKLSIAHELTNASNCDKHISSTITNAINNDKYN